MSRLNGRLPGSHATSDHERDPDLEPSCLVRTPSGNFYNIPKIPKNEYNNKNQSTGNSPIKVELQNNMDRVPLPYGHAPSMIPMRRQSIRCHFRKGIDWCSWKLIAIIVIMLLLCLTAALAYVAASNLVNWSYQGTKACTVLVGENTDAKPSSSESNKTSSSSTSTSSQSSGRTRQPSSSGGSIKTSDSMLLDGVYSRKRRDTFNEHALHQNVPPPPPSHDPEELPLTPADSVTAKTAASGQRLVPLHEERPGKVVHDTKHAVGPDPVKAAIDHVETETAEDASSWSSGSTTHLQAVPLLVNVSSTTNYSHDRSSHTTVAVDLISSSFTSVDSDSLPSSSVRESRNEASSTSSQLLAESPEDTAEYPVVVEGAADVVATLREEEHVGSRVSKLAHDDLADFDYAANTGTSESSDIAGTMDDIETTTSASGVELAKLGTDSSDYDEVPIVDTTIEKENNELAANYSSNVDLPDSIVESTTVISSGVHTDELTEENQRLHVSNFDWDTKVSSGEDLIPVETNQEVVNVNTISSSININNETAFDTSLDENENIEKMEKNVEDVVFVEERDDLSKEKISSDGNDRFVAPTENDDIPKTIGTVTKSLQSQAADVVKETRELSREYSSSESEASSNIVKAAERPEELQRDYPIPIYRYGQDEVEIINLHQKKRPIATVKSEDAAKSPDPKSINNDAKMIAVSQDERDKNNLRVIMREESDEEFLRKFEEKFRATSAEIDESVENFSSIKTDHNSFPTDTVHDSSNNASPRFSSVNRDNPSVPPMTQRVQIVEVPVQRDDHRSDSSSSSSSSPHRVLINITIASEDLSAASSRPLYVLSVSVPTENDANGRTPGININQAQVHAAERPPEPAASMLKKIGTNGESINALDTMRLPPPPHPPASPPPAPIWAGGECECSCPCMGSASDEWDNFSAIDDSANLEEFEHANSTLLTEKSRESKEKPEDKEERDEESFLAPGDPVRNKNVIPTTEDYYPSSIDHTVENSESTSETTSTYEPEVSSDMWACSGSTPLPPEPTILILEGARTFPARSFPPDGTTFAQVGLGQKLSKEIPPYGYWNMQFYQSEAAYVRFDYSIPRGASIGVYARRNALPTHTQYDLLEVLSGFKARTTRASHPSIKKEVTQYMEPGHWFLSLYNDDGDLHEVSFIAVIAEDMTHNCPNGCSGKGECLLGHCQCNPGFGGEDCSESVCPVLCSQRGEYINGECQCNPGWKGKECSLRHDECEVPDCNGHGHCTNGKCNCVRGYKGKYCEEVDCPHPTCSGHGFCAEGTCICKKGWKGADCSQMDKEALQCLPDCSGHGNFDLETQTCLCEPMWSGDDCSKELCDLDCGPHGHCVDNACDCLPGWSGELCNLKQCDPRCNEHGQCKNGTCLCVTGWNGKHCTMEGCPNSCSGHGQCRVSNDAQWECQCYDGWDGKDCSVLLEQNCNDGRDNDKVYSYGMLTGKQTARQRDVETTTVYTARRGSIS